MRGRPRRAPRDTVRARGKNGRGAYLALRACELAHQIGDTLPTIGSRRWIWIPAYDAAGQLARFRIGQRKQLALEVLEVVRGRRLLEHLFDDREKEVQATDGWQGWGVMGPKTPARCAEQQRGQDDPERNSTLVEGSCQTSITPAGARRRSWQPEVSVEDRFTVEATRIGCDAAHATLLAVPRRSPGSCTRGRKASRGTCLGWFRRCPFGHVHAGVPRLWPDYEDRFRPRKIDPSQPFLSGAYEARAGGLDDPHGLRESADVYDWRYGVPLCALELGSACRSRAAHGSRAGRHRTPYCTSRTLAAAEGRVRSSPSLPEAGFDSDARAMGGSACHGVEPHAYPGRWPRSLSRSAGAFPFFRREAYRGRRRAFGADDDAALSARGNQSTGYNAPGCPTIDATDLGRRYPTRSSLRDNPPSFSSRIPICSLSPGASIAKSGAISAVSGSGNSKRSARSVLWGHRATTWGG